MISPSSNLSIPSADLVLAPSDRASRSFARWWQRQHMMVLNGGEAAFSLTMPRFQSLRTWFALLWRDGQFFGLIDDEHTVLNSASEMVLWRHIAQDTLSLSAAMSGAIARQLSEAWQLEHGYGNGSTTAFAQGDNGELYRMARRRFVSYLNDHQLLTTAQLPLQLAEYAQALASEVPAQICLTPSFAPVPSEMRALQRLTQAARANWVHLPVDAAASATVQRYEFRDAAEERTMALGWARSQLLAAAETSGALAHGLPLAIVVPDLQQTRAVWERALIESRLPYNLSLGLSLSEYPWVNAGLAVLRSVWQPEATELLSQALRQSRWALTVCRSKPWLTRERQLLEMARFEVDLSDWLQGIDGSLAAAVQALRQQYSDTVRQQRQAWLPVFTQLLLHLGEQQHDIGSHLYQLQMANERVLQQWTQLDELLPNVSALSALAELRMLMESTPFQPEGSDAPLQVVGLLESAGVPFSAMWVCGLNERSLPEATRPNPLLATDWQRANDVGLAGYEQVEKRASNLFGIWQQLGHVLSLSVAKEQDGEPVVPSPLLRNLSVSSAPEFAMSQQTLTESNTIADETAQPWRGVTRSSAGQLEAQALCPRKGFTVARLKLQDWPQRTEGLSPPERGSMVHRIVEALGRRRMQGASSDELRAVLLAIIQTELASLSAMRPTINPLYWTLEAPRLQKLMADFISVEAEREPFQVVEIESRLKAEIEGLQFSLRLDRVEATGEQGDPVDSVCVVDFKTGNPSVSDLDTDRLVAPQLPLYALAWEQSHPDSTVSAVSFAVIRDEGAAYRGIGSAENPLSPVPKKNATPYEILKARWPAQLQTLAHELLAGEAAVAPVNGAATCQYCEYTRFCRVELTGLQGDDETVGVGTVAGVGDE